MAQQPSHLQWELILLMEHTVATMGTGAINVIHCCNNGDRDHCWFTTMTSDHIITTVTLDTIVDFDRIVAFVIPLK
jgi:hypothetical protein